MSRWITERRTLFILIFAWGAVVAGGMLYLTDYATQPADGGNVDNKWPAQSFAFQDERPVLLLFLHPRCPCSRASVNQFRKHVANTTDDVHTVAVIRSAPEFEGLRLGNDLSLAVRQIPGICIIRDSSGQIAEQFGVATSGHVLLFDPDKKLLFSGGVTESRGHEGDNRGARSLARALAHCRSRRLNTQEAMETKPILTCVYGCALGAHNESPSRKATR